jgi:hypothetical protein
LIALVDTMERLAGREATDSGQGGDARGGRSSGDHGGGRAVGGGDQSGVRILSQLCLHQGCSQQFCAHGIHTRSPHALDDAVL